MEGRVTNLGIVLALSLCRRMVTWLFVGDSMPIDRRHGRWLKKLECCTWVSPERSVCILHAGGNIHVWVTRSSRLPPPPLNQPGDCFGIEPMSPYGDLALCRRLNAYWQKARALAEKAWVLHVGVTREKCIIIFISILLYITLCTCTGLPIWCFVLS